MDDLISRRKAIDAVHEEFDECTVWDESGEYTADAVERILDDVPAAQPAEDIRAICSECDAWNQYKNYPQPGWIPCTPETMPKNEEEVIVSILDDSGDNAFKYTASGWYAVAGDFWVVDNEMNRHVVAWMPLPKPYTGKDGDNHEE